MAGDADNQLLVVFLLCYSPKSYACTRYSERIIKTYTQLGKLKDAGGPNADLVDFYHLETKERVTVLTNSLYNMRELDPSAQMKMDRLRDELCARNEHEIKTRLKSVNHKIDYSVLAAVTGSERIERVL
jgi:phosphoribosylamine-glycine ligase